MRNAATVGDLLVPSERLAVVFEERRLSYAQLQERVDRLANGLLGRGLAPGDRVALFMENRAEAWEAILACARAGLVWVPLNYMLKERELGSILSHSGARALLVAPELWPTIAPAASGLDAVQLGEDYERLIAGSDSARPSVAIDSEDTFCLLYTSGTTGLPKGTMLTHRTILAHAAMVRDVYCITSDSVGLVVLPYFVGATLNCVQIPGLSLSIPLVFNRKFSPAAFFDLIRRERVTHVQTVPTMLVRLLDSPEIDRADLSSIDTIGYGSAPMPVDRLKQLLDRFGPIFTQIYGLTETCAMATVLRPEEHVGERLPSCGRAAPLVELRLNADGEVLLRGPTVMKGYWRMDDVLEDGWFRTGDLARQDSDGFIYLLDRKKDMIITGGFNVYPTEVEQVIFGHPAVADCAVFGLADPEWGEAVTAVIVARAPVTEAEIVDLCRRELAGYKKPRRVIFADEIPRNPSGKVLKRVLRDSYAAAR